MTDEHIIKTRARLEQMKIDLATIGVEYQPDYRETWWDFVVLANGALSNALRHMPEPAGV